MENRKLIELSFIVLVVGGSVVFTTPKTRAYDFNTHAFLTSATVQFYQKSFPANQFPQDLIPYLVDGSRREDDSPRWLQHFYDPVYERGYTYDTRTGAVLNIGSTHESSKQWAQDSNEQNSPTYKVASVIASILDSIQKQKINITTESDFSWDTAIRYWQSGQREKAMFALGHALHLVEDASVPDHTRNNGHADGSPYEEWTARFNPENPDTELQKRLADKQIFILPTLNDYFGSIAQYSNNGFYSKDTIGIQSGYRWPQPDGFISTYHGCFAVKTDDIGEYRLYKQSGCNSFIVTSAFSAITRSDEVSSDYWSRLSTKDIQHTAGVLNLFFQQVQQPKTNQQSWLERIQQWLNTQQQNARDMFGQVFQLNDTTPLPTPSQTLIEIGTPMPSSSPSPEQLPSIVPSPSPHVSGTVDNIPSAQEPPDPIPPLPFSNIQTPNAPTTGQDVLATPSPNISTAPTPDTSPTPSVTPEPNPQIPSPSPTPELSPIPTSTPEISPSPIPTPFIQHSNNPYLDNVQWYFDQTTASEKGGLFTVEYDVLQLLPLDDLHAVIAGWNTDLVVTQGTKQDGYNTLMAQYNIAGQTGVFINTADPFYGKTVSLWTWQGTFADASTTFPLHIKLTPTVLRTPANMWLTQDEPSGISRQQFENILGREVGTNDFITLGYWPTQHNTTPQPDNVHYAGSFLQNASPQIQYPQPQEIPAIKNIYWGPSPNSATGYGLEMEYALPFDTIHNNWNTGGYELRFFLNRNIDFIYGYDTNMAQDGFLDNDTQSKTIWLNYETCSGNAQNTNKYGLRYPTDAQCILIPFNLSAIRPTAMPNYYATSSPSWIIQLPIMQTPKAWSDLNENDYISAAFLQYDSGPNTGLFLRQVDSRQWHFSPTYAPLIPTVATTTQ